MYEWHVANELQRVAESVVAADEDAFVGQWSATPDPLLVTRKMPAGRTRAIAQRCIADVPRLVELAEAHQREPPLEIVHRFAGSAKSAPPIRRAGAAGLKSSPSATRFLRTTATTPRR